VARRPGTPGAAEVSGTPGRHPPPSRQLDEEQDVEPLQKERVDCEEVALEDARRLRPQELRPAQPLPRRGGLDPRLLQDRPDSARGELHAETGELAVDPSGPPSPDSRRPAPPPLSTAAQERDADTSSSALFVLPFDSALTIRTRPTSAVEATCVPPSAWRSRPTMSTTRSGSIERGTRSALRRSSDGSRSA